MKKQTAKAGYILRHKEDNGEYTYAQSIILPDNAEEWEEVEYTDTDEQEEQSEQSE